MSLDDPSFFISKAVFITLAIYVFIPIIAYP